ILTTKLSFNYLFSISVSFVFVCFCFCFFSFIPTFFLFYAFYFLAKRYSINPILHLFIGIITFSGSTSIFIFMFRNKQPVDTTGMDVIDTPYTEDNTNTEQ